MSHPITDSLNPRQKEAVESWQGPLLILAGAGSGKTRVLTHRIAYLIGACDVRPWQILAVTFTNKAAREMRERVEKLLGQNAREVMLGTFHACCLRILRRESAHLGFERDFVIYDVDDQLRLLKSILQDLNINEKMTPPRSVHNRISTAKNHLIPPGQYLEHVADPTFLDERVARIYTEYQRQLHRNGAMDFDDLIMKPIELFKQYPQILDRYQERFKFILVDEYQDTNHAQYVLINLLAEKYRNICCVGDDDQSIYGWRGADISNILSFEKDYPEAKVVRLEQNYRSTSVILKAASAVVRHNAMRKGKELWTDQEGGHPIVLLESQDEREEADEIVNEIRAITDSKPGVDLGDIAILYRTNAQSRVFEDSFRWSKIPYTIVGGLRFYERREIKDALAYLRLVVNPDDTMSLMRIINVPRRGIGNTTIDRLNDYAREHDISVAEAIQHIDQIDTISAGLKGKVREFGHLIRRYQQARTELAPHEIAEGLLSEAGYLAYLRTEYGKEAEDRLENITELFTALKTHTEEAIDPSLETFLSDVALVADVDQWDDKQRSVTLMTLHSAKGLEFQHVFIAGLEDGLLPHASSIDEPGQLEEERRLFYVGITRAKKVLYLSYALTRRRYGYEPMATMPSRFVGEIPQQFVQESAKARAKKRSSKQSGPPQRQSVISSYQKSKPASTPKSSGKGLFAVGERVQHASFGAGKITHCEGNGDNQKVTIMFDDNTRRKLIVKYANLTRI